MDSIRVSSRIKKIEVNDDGEYIKLNFGDKSFPMRYFQMVENVKSFNAKAADEAKELDAKFSDDVGSDAYKLAVQQFECKLYENVKHEIDALFGRDACRKVFGDILPDMDCYMEFLEKMKPFFEEYAAARNSVTSKYSAERTGNV